MSDQGRSPTDRARDAKARMKQASADVGLAPKGLLADARPGAVYTVRDVAIALPETRIPKAPARTVHAERRIILVQSAALATAASPKTLLVVPCSASQGGPSAWDLRVPPDEPAFDKSMVVAFTSLVQPILKSDVMAYCGQLTDASLDLLLARLLENLGVRAPLMTKLPPRLAAESAVEAQ
jgi:hypothetical protein